MQILNIETGVNVQQQFFCFPSRYRYVSRVPSFMPIDSFCGSISPFSILFRIIYDICVKIASIFAPDFAEHSMKKRPFFLATLKP
jgi:hypothetical protein